MFNIIKWSLFDGNHDHPHYQDQNEECWPDCYLQENVFLLNIVASSPEKVPSQE